MDRFCCFMLVCVVMSCLIFVALWSSAGKGLTLGYSVCVVFCHFPSCVLVRIRVRGGVGAVRLV